MELAGEKGNSDSPTPPKNEIFEVEAKRKLSLVEATEGVGCVVKNAAQNEPTTRGPEKWKSFPIFPSSLAEN